MKALLLASTLAILVSGMVQAEPADVRNNFAIHGVTFYYAPDAKANPGETFDALAKEFFPGVAIVKGEEDLPNPPFIHFDQEEAPLTHYPPPEEEDFDHANRGLSKEEFAAIQKTRSATNIRLVVPKEDAWTSGRKFTNFAHRFAEATGAFLWDSITRECFTKEEWKKTRLETWPETGVPDVTLHVTGHIYQPDDDSAYLRIITLGMEKFALPDIVVERTTRSEARQTGTMINLVCQLLAENPTVDQDKTTFRINDIKCEELRTWMNSGLGEKATGEITLAFLPGKPSEGDPENELLQVSFRLGEGKSEDEKRNFLLSRLWGSSDEVKGIEHTDEIMAASEAAKKKLPELKQRFDKGLETGTKLLLKAPFQRDDEGNEWMWIEVMGWADDGQIHGILMNDPFYIKELKSGSRVTVKQDEIFDYILYLKDGTTEGNETGKLMEKQDGPVKTK